MDGAIYILSVRHALTSPRYHIYHIPSLPSSPWTSTRSVSYCPDLEISSDARNTSWQVSKTYIISRIEDKRLSRANYYPPKTWTSWLFQSSDFELSILRLIGYVRPSEGTHTHARTSTNSIRISESKNCRRKWKRKRLSEMIQLTDLSTWMTPSNESARWLLSKTTLSICSLSPLLSLPFTVAGICRIIPGIIAVEDRRDPLTSASDAGWNIPASKLQP